MARGKHKTCAMLFALLFMTLAAGRVPDRCEFKMGFDCYSDPKCFWESPEEGDATLDSMLAAPFAKKVCPLLVEGIIEAREQNALEALLQSEVVCGYFCGDYSVDDCKTSSLTMEELIAESAASPVAPPVIEDPVVLRKLQSAFESGDWSQARRVLMSSVPVPETIGEYFDTMISCEMCLKCHEEPVGLSNDVWMWTHLDVEGLFAVCETTLAPSPEGYCRSRCDPERLDPEDCHKEKDYCICAISEPGSDGTPGSDLMTEKEFEALQTHNNTLDLLCPEEQFTPEDILTTCQAFIEKRQSFAEDIEVNVEATCRGFCPVDGACISGYRERADLTRYSAFTTEMIEIPAEWSATGVEWYPTAPPSEESPALAPNRVGATEAETSNSTKTTPEDTSAAFGSEMGEETTGDSDDDAAPSEISVRRRQLMGALETRTLSAMSPAPAPDLAFADAFPELGQPQGTYVGLLNCSLCEHCKAKPEMYGEWTDVDACVAFVNGMLNNCSSAQATPEAFPEDKFCSEKCMPMEKSIDCNSLVDKDACHRAAECRWNGESEDAMGDFVRYDSSRYLRETTCPAQAAMIMQLKKATNDEELMSICRAAMDCDAIDTNFCSTFIDSEDSSPNARRLLSFDEKMHFHLNSEHFKTTFARRLTSFTTDDWLSSVALQDLGKKAVTCEMCSGVCDNLSELKQLSGAPVDASTVDAYIQHCGNMFDSEMETKSSCQSVCSTIPAGDCNKYKDHCTCQKYYDDSVETEPETCDCKAKEEYRDMCLLQKNNTCPEGCTLVPEMIEMRDYYMEERWDLANKTAVSMITSVWQMQQSTQTTGLSSELICQLAGRCDENCDACLQTDIPQRIIQFFEENMLGITIDEMLELAESEINALNQKQAVKLLESSAQTLPPELIVSVIENETSSVHPHQIIPLLEMETSKIDPMDLFLLLQKDPSRLDREALFYLLGENAHRLDTKALLQMIEHHVPNLRKKELLRMAHRIATGSLGQKDLLSILENRAVMPNAARLLELLQEDAANISSEEMLRVVAANPDSVESQDLFALLEKSAPKMERQDSTDFFENAISNLERNQVKPVLRGVTKNLNPDELRLMLATETTTFVDPHNLTVILMEFAESDFKREACALTVCAFDSWYEGSCSDDRCQNACEKPLEEDDRKGPRCSCETVPTTENSDCEYVSPKDRCGEGCGPSEDKSWSDAYTESYQEQLSYVSMLIARFKLEAAKHPDGWSEDLSTTDVCMWIDACPEDNSCESKIAYSTVPDSCAECAGCMSSEEVEHIVHLFQTATEDKWNAELSKFADLEAKIQATQETCRPTTCDAYVDNQSTCVSTSGCYWHCETPTEEQEEPDECTDFILKWEERLADPIPFCNKQDDVSASDCVETMEFFSDMTAAGHLSSLKARMKLCKMFDKLPTVDIIKKRMGFLFCDPKQQCCGQTSVFEGTGIALTKSGCNSREGCEYRSECVPIRDECYESILAASKAVDANDLPSCGSGCAFVESSGLNSVETAHGRGFCVDLLAEETCKTSALFSCNEENCIEKPVCSSKIGMEFPCLGGDACCISTIDGVIDPSQCSAAEGCQLGKRCVSALDECGYFQNEWECDYRKTCTFVPTMNAYDRSAGRCVSKRDRCERLDEDACEADTNCRLIDNCETAECSPDDQCCSYNMRECRQDATCASRSACKLKKEYDICALFESAEECPKVYGLCAWDETEGECRAAEDYCASIEKKEGCVYSSSCEYEEKCIDACESCATCISTFSTLLEEEETISTSKLQRRFVAACMNSGYDVFNCYATSRTIAVSRGSWGRQPGAICLSLGSCLESCVDNEGDALSRCSATGWDDGTTYTDPEDPCDSCTSGEFCKKRGSSATIVCQCNPLTGFDTCKRFGQCVDRCVKYQARIDEFNSVFTPCTDDSECPSDFTCSAEAVARVMSCSDGIVDVALSTGSCVPQSRTMTEAQFANSGRYITVTLNYPARTDRFLASEIFDAATSNLLGSAVCVVSGKMMRIFLRGGAKVVPGDAIVLRNGQTRLRDAVGGLSFDNPGIPIGVDSCTSCAKPRIRINSPARISAGCASQEPPKATFDASQTVDSTGRRIVCQWTAGIDGSGNDCFRTSLTDGTYNTCEDLALELQDKTSPVLVFSPSFIQTLAAQPGFYNMQLTCSNFLGMSDTKDVEVEVVGDPMPLISAPPSVTFQRARGVVVPASISQDSICPGDSVEYTWTSSDLEIPDDSYAYKDFRMAGYPGAFSAESYTLDLLASLRRSDGVLRSETASAQVMLYPVGSPVVSGLSGVAGDVVMARDIVLTTFCLDPDDPANVEDPFGYDYYCVRANAGSTELVFDESSTVPCDSLGTISDDTITLKSSDLPVKDVWYIYTFTCIKDTRQHTSVVVFRPREADRQIPTGRVRRLCSGDCPELHDPNRDLALRVVDLAYTDTSIAWSCSVDLQADDVLGGSFSGRKFIIKGGSIPEVDSFDCVATLTRGTEVGEARVTVGINSKPFCTKDTSCTSVELVSENNEFPLCRYKISCLDFADDQEEALTYGFGCYDDSGRSRVLFKGSHTSYEIGGLAIGSHTCFVAASDTYGSETVENVTVVVEQPSSGVTEEVLQTVVDDMDRALSSGDGHAVLRTVGTAVLLIEPSTDEEDEITSSAPAPEPSDSAEASQGMPARRRSLLSTTTISSDALADNVITSLGNFTVFDDALFKPAATQLADLADEVTYATLISVATTMEEGMAASTLAAASYTSEERNQLALDIATVLANIVDAWGRPNAVDEAVQLYNALLEYGETLLCDNVALGQSDFVTATLANNDAVALSCMKDQPIDLAGSTYSLGSVSVSFPSEFATACGGVCPADVELKLSSADNINLHVNYLSSVVDAVNATDVQVLSGIVKIEAAGLTTDSFCSDPACTLTVTIPVSSFDDTKTTACVRIVDDVAEGLNDEAGISFVLGSYSDSDGTVQCEVTNLGEIFVVEFDSVDIQSTVATPQSTTETDEAVETDSQVVQSTVRFVGLNYTEYAADEEKSNQLKSDIATQLEAASPIENATFAVTQLLEGSIIAVFEITLPAGTTQTEIDALTATIENNPDSFFDTSFRENYGVSDIVYVAPEEEAALTTPPTTPPSTPPQSSDSVEQQATPPSAAGPVPGTSQPTSPPEDAEAPEPDSTVVTAEIEDGGGDGTNVAAIVAPVVVGVTVIGGAAGFFAFRRFSTHRKNRAFLEDL